LTLRSLGEAGQSGPPAGEERSRTERYRKLAARLGDWLEESDDYDAEVRPLVEAEPKDTGPAP